MNEDFNRGSQNGLFFFFVGAIIVIISAAAMKAATFPIRTAAGFSLLGVFLATQKPEQDFNKQDLSVRQLSCFLSFYEYDEQQWNRYLIDQGMQEVVHWNELDDLLNALGVKEYVTYQ